VIFDHYQVTVIGAVRLQTATGTSSLPFRIEGKINIAAIRSAVSRKAALKAMESMASAAAEQVPRHLLCQPLSEDRVVF
jgi:hypothetical protein